MTEIYIQIALVFGCMFFVAIIVWSLLTIVRRKKLEQETLAPECETDRRKTTVEFDGNKFEI